MWWLQARRIRLHLRPLNGFEAAGRVSDLRSGWQLPACSNMRIVKLFDVALQHDQKFLQMLAAFRRRVGVFNAMLHVGMNQFFGERLQTFAGRHQLRQDFHAVAVFVQHAFNGVKLPDHLAHAQFQGFPLIRRMLVSVAFHGGRIREAGNSRKGERIPFAIRGVGV